MPHAALQSDSSGTPAVLSAVHAASEMTVLSGLNKSTADDTPQITKGLLQSPVVNHSDWCIQAEAERRKRAQILESEGDRQSKINVAEGDKAQVQARCSMLHARSTHFSQDQKCCLDRRQSTASIVSAHS